jgi:hypothetical protein
MVLERIFEPKRKKVTGCCEKLHNEELHILNSPLQKKRVRSANPEEKDGWGM